MILFNRKKKQPAKPYVWKEYETFGTLHTEYRFFRGLKREWGRISVNKKGEVTWEYIHYHPFKNLIRLNDENSIKDVPLWFIHCLRKQSC